MLSLSNSFAHHILKRLSQNKRFVLNGKKSQSRILISHFYSLDDFDAGIWSLLVKKLRSITLERAEARAIAPAPAPSLPLQQSWKMRSPRASESQSLRENFSAPLHQSWKRRARARARPFLSQREFLSPHLLSAKPPWGASVYQYHDYLKQYQVQEKAVLWMQTRAGHVPYPHIRIYSRILSASFRICRIRMAIPNANSTHQDVKVEKAFFQLGSFSEQISVSERKDKSSLPVFHQESIWKIVCKVF